MCSDIWSLTFLAMYRLAMVSWHVQHSHLLHHVLASCCSQGQTAIRWDEKTCNLAPGGRFEAHDLWHICKVTKARQLILSQHITSAVQYSVMKC